MSSHLMRLALEGRRSAPSKGTTLIPEIDKLKAWVGFQHRLERMRANSA